MNNNEIKDLLPSINYLIDLNLNQMKQNDKLIDEKLFQFKTQLDKVIKIKCKESYDFLITNKHLYEENNSEKLFNYKFSNITCEARKDLANQFIKCVNKISDEANRLVNKMSDQQDEINKKFKNCKKLCLFDNQKNLERVKVVECFNECLNGVKKEHDVYSSNYISEINKIKLN